MGGVTFPLWHLPKPSRLPTRGPHPSLQPVQTSYVDRTGADKKHRCLWALNNLGPLGGQYRLPGCQRLSPAQIQNPMPRNSLCQPGRRRAPSLRGHDAPICGSRPCRGDKRPPSAADAFLWVGRGAVGDGYPYARKRCPKSGKGATLLSTGRVLAGDCPPCIRREALRLPSGPGSPRQLCPSLSQGALSVRAGRPAAAAPLASPSCSLSLLLPFACPPTLCLQLPGLPGGEESVSLEDCTHLQRPRFLARRARAPAGCREQRRERTGPSSSCSEPRVWGEGSRRAAAVAAAASGRGWDAGSLAGLGAKDQRIRLAQGRLEDGEPYTQRGDRALQQRRCAGLSRTRGSGQLAGLPGP